MKFLIDGTLARVKHCRDLWPEGIAGQLNTPGSRWKSERETPFAIDNGAYVRLDLAGFIRLIERYEAFNPLFVAIPDKVGCHRTTLAMYEEHSHLARSCKRAFVAQDGFDGYPPCAQAIFIGGTNKFKDSDEARDLARRSAAAGLHVHVGRVNEPLRYWRYTAAGAHTCDGSGISKYDHMLISLRDF